MRIVVDSNRSTPGKVFRRYNYQIEKYPYYIPYGHISCQPFYHYYPLILVFLQSRQYCLKFFDSQVTNIHDATHNF